MGKGLIISIIILVVIVAGFVYIGSRDTTSEPAPNIVVNVEPTDTTDTTIETGAQTLSVEITSSGFSPSTLTINGGDTITFTNQGSSSSWPASAIHPTHTVYPGSSISKCGSSTESSIFDACKGLAQGESYSFTFNEVGTWNYHNHLKPSMTGSVTVS